MNRYEMVVKIEEIIKLADMKKYKEACEVLDTINTSKMKKYEDLIIFAEVYLKNKRYMEAKEILKRIHEKTTTRRLLTLLISVNSKMHNYVEAEECYREYVKIAPKDVNRFILRYKIDKSKGLGYDALIKPLEQLKEYDIIEEWEYELAKLYHKAGYGDKCISECNTIIMMFGTGAIVEKAKLLRDHHIDALIEDDDENKDLTEFNATVQLDNIIGKVRRKLGVEDSAPIESSSSEDYGEGMSVSPQIEDEYAKDNDKITNNFFDNEGIDEKDEVEAAILKELQNDEVDELDVKFDKGNFFLKAKEQKLEQEANKEKTENEESKNELVKEEEESSKEDAKEELEEDFFGKDEVESLKADDIKEEEQQEEQSIEEKPAEEKASEEMDDDFLNSISNLVSSQVDLLIDEAKQEFEKEGKASEETEEPNLEETETEEIKTEETKTEETKTEETKTEELKTADSKPEEVESVDVREEEIKEEVKEDIKEEEEQQEENVEAKAEEVKVEEPKVSLKVVTIEGVEPILSDEEYNKIMEKLTVLLTPSMYDDFNEKDINENTFRNYYNIPYLRANIKCALGNTERNVVKGNFIICGNAKSGRTTIAKMIAKEAYGRDIIETSKVARIEASKFNSVDLGLKQSKLADGCLIIQNAHELSINAMTALITMIIHLNGRILVFLETDYDNIASLYILTEEVREYFNSVVTTPDYSQAELIGFARSYAAYKGYSFTENGIKSMDELIESVYNKIAVNERVPFVLTAIEKAIRASQNRNKGFGRTNYDGLNILDVQDVEQQYI